MDMMGKVSWTGTLPLLLLQSLQYFSYKSHVVVLGTADAVTDVSGREYEKATIKFT